MTKVQQVRKEFNEPFRDVIAGFAEMGYSRKATAQILEINTSYFRQLIGYYAPDAPWKRQAEMREECKPRPSKGKGGWPKGKKRNKPQKYSDDYLLSLVRKHWDLPYRIFELLAPVSASTISRRFGTWNNARKLAAAISNETLNGES